jgi:predicted transposase/invertase (TIGR01784 family)
LKYEKAASDEITRIYGAKKEGRREGREEGKKEGKREEKLAIAQKMKNRGLPAGQIAEDTGLSGEEVTKL